MAQNTPQPQQQLGATSDVLKSKAGAARQLIVDTTKNTAVIMDGSTMGGHPMAKESRKLKSGSPNVKINDGAEADLSGDITITVLPGTVPGGMVVVTDPEGQEAGQYLQVSYTDTDGQAAKYYVNLNKLVDKYLAGSGIKIVDNTVSVDAATFVSAVAAVGGGIVTDAEGKLMIAPGQLITASKGLAVDSNGKLVVDLTVLVSDDANNLITVKDNKLLLSSVVSADEGNILAAGSDGKVYFPADLGTL